MISPLTTSFTAFNKRHTMLRSILFTTFVVFAISEKISFENYKVFRIIPTSREQLELLKHLENLNGNLSYWSSPSRVYHPVDLMVPPSEQYEFDELMNIADMEYETYVDDVQNLIDRENPVQRSAGFGWTKYHTLEEIYNWLESLADNYSNKVKIINAGRTYQGRTIKGVKLSFGKNKPGIFIEGGIHAREWISPATVTYLLNEFLTSKNKAVRALAESYDWYMFPCFNPDGYVYTHTSNRLWRKTLSPTPNKNCKGVDANRNWGFKWNQGGASKNSCAETYPGKRAFSEIETKTMSEYIKSISRKLFAYISFHSYSQLLLFPYGHTPAHLDNYAESLAIGRKTIRALEAVYGTRYKTGNIAETIYVASGGSMDWVKAKFKLPVVFTYELRDIGKYGFVLPAYQIIPNCKEILASFVAMFQQAKKFGYPKSRH